MNSRRDEWKSRHIPESIDQYPCSPHRRSLEIPRREGVLKAAHLEEK